MLDNNAEGVFILTSVSNEIKLSQIHIKMSFIYLIGYKLYRKLHVILCDWDILISVYLGH